MRCLLFMWLFTGCTPLLVLHGAQPIPQGQVEIQVAGVSQTNAGERTYLFPPFAVLGARIGVHDDIDIGTRILPGGLGADVRYRFWNGGRLHLAMTPGFDAAYDAESTTLITDFRAPLTLEWAPGHNLSFIMDTRVVLREFWMVGSFPGGPGQFNRLEAFLGGGARFEWHPKRFRLGLGIQAFHQPVDAGRVAVSGGLDFGLRIGRAKGTPKKPRSKRARD